MKDMGFKEQSNEGYGLQRNLPFLPERIKIHKVEKTVATLHDKK